MSDRPTLVTEQHFAYLAERTAGDDAFLVEMKRAAAEAGLPPIWINPAQASFMGILLRLHRAKEVVEVGTLAGYSAITMARALPPDGRVRTFEIHEAHAAFAAEWVARSDVADRVEVLRGSGSELLRDVEDRSVDAVFLDADKSGYAGYLEHALRILRPGGLFLADNAFAFGQLFDAQPTDREVPAMRAFNDLLAAEPRVDAVIVPMGDGLWVGVVDPGA